MQNENDKRADQIISMPCYCGHDCPKFPCKEISDYQIKYMNKSNQLELLQ